MIQPPQYHRDLLTVEIPSGYGEDRKRALIQWALCNLDIGSTLTIAEPGASRRAPTRVRPRRPSIATLLKRAEKTGKTVTSITTPDGTTIHFGEPEPGEANNPWLADIGEATKQ